MSYLVIARKYRPRRFDEVVGQPAVAQTLRNAIELGRVAHAYLFAGPRGVGKTSLARILARALCCEKGPTPDPCDECSRCQSILKGNDLDIVEIDAASNRGIDDIRSLREKARVAPMRGRTKLYIIDEVHQLTSEAFNALLKTLEEPPPHVIFVLATTEPERIPDTIRSRCQCFEFGRVADVEIVARLTEICKREEIEFEEKALPILARASKGGVRDSQSLLDQLITYGGGKITVDDAIAVTGALSSEVVHGVLGAALSGDLATVIEEVERLYRSGIAAETLIDALLDEIRELMVVCATGHDSELGKRASDWVRERSNAIDVDQALAMANILLAGKKRIAEHDEPRLPLEATLLRVARLADSMPISAAIDLLRSGPPPGGGGGGTSSPRSTPRVPAPTGSSPPPLGGGSPASQRGGGPSVRGGSSVDDPQGLLRDIVEECKDRSGAVAAFLGNFRATRVEGDLLLVTSSGRVSGLFNLDHAKVKKLVAEVTNELIGRRLELSERREPAPSSAPSANPTVARSAVERAKKMFDGQVIE